MSVPNGPINRKYTIFPTFFDTFTNHEGAQRAPQDSETEGFGGHSKHLLESFGDFGMTFRRSGLMRVTWESF